jgi:hypothetical protein
MYVDIYGRNWLVKLYRTNKGLLYYISPRTRIATYARSKNGALIPIFFRFTVTPSGSTSNAVEVYYPAVAGETVCRNYIRPIGFKQICTTSQLDGREKQLSTPSDHLSEFEEFALSWTDNISLLFVHHQYWLSRTRVSYPHLRRIYIKDKFNISSLRPPWGLFHVNSSP